VGADFGRHHQRLGGMMRFFTRLFGNWTGKSQLDADLNEELASYRQLLEDEKVRAGLDRQTARREAAMEIGALPNIQENVREVRAGFLMESMVKELRQSFRGLRRNAALSVLAIAILSLGIGASTLVFSIVQATLLQPLPIRDAGRVVQVWESRKDRNMDSVVFTEATFWDVRSMNRSFSELGAATNNNAILTGDGEPLRISVSFVTAGLFRALGVSPLTGRDFDYNEVQPGFSGQQAVIIGRRLWSLRYGSDPAIVGRSVRLDGKPFQVIGVMPDIPGVMQDDFYIPFGFRPNADRNSWEFQVVGRLKDDVSMEAANADLQRVATLLKETYPGPLKGLGFRIDPSSSWLANDNARLALYILLGSVLFLLFIACANIANMLLARGASRQREIAVRTALGAGRGRLIRFVLLESLILSLIGSVVGLVLAYFGINVLRTISIPGLSRLEEAAINPWVLTFAVVAALLTGLVSGLAPALQAPRVNIAGLLNGAGRQTGSRAQDRLRSALVVAEVALSFALLAGAGLFLRSFAFLNNSPTGYQTANRLFFSVSMPDSYFDNGRAKQVADELLRRLRSAPGTVSAASISSRPIEGGNPGMGIVAAQRKDLAPPWAGWRFITPEYFQTAGIPLLRGRQFTEADPSVWGINGRPVPNRRVILSNRLAKTLFPDGADPVGQSVILWAGQSGRPAEVVGVVGDAAERGAATGESLTVYMPSGENAVPRDFIVQTQGDPAVLAASVRSLVASVDSTLPVSNVRTFDEILRRSLRSQRFSTGFLSLFSGLALLLAMAGIYGVLSYTMSRRIPEIGLRVALGASSASILKMSLSAGLKPALLGIGLGALGAVWMAQYLKSLLFGVQPLDLAAFVGAGLLLLAAAALACYIPSRRASLVDPAVALRAE
jgi:putative ABC transport system permease protein